MADVTRIPGVWEQVRLVATLRWRILRNSLRKKNNQWDLIGTIIAGIFAGLAVMGVSVGFGFGAYTLMSGGHEAWIALPFWGIFLFWQLFPVFTAGFGAGFDFRNLLRFPLSLRAFYILGLAYGLADFAAIASICWLIATILGATMANAAILPAMLVISLLFVLMNITLERLIGSWLERILARRRSREIFFALFILFAVSVQFINPMLQKIRALGAALGRASTPLPGYFSSISCGPGRSWRGPKSLRGHAPWIRRRHSLCPAFQRVPVVALCQAISRRRTQRNGRSFAFARSPRCPYRRSIRRATLAHSASCRGPSQRVPLPYA